MRTIYLREDLEGFSRKVLIDMAYLVSHKKIRLLKRYYKETLYLPYYSNSHPATKPERYFLTKDKILKEDEHHYFFNFPFKFDEVEGKEP